MWYFLSLGLFCIKLLQLFLPLPPLSPSRPPFLSVCLSLTILAAVHCLDKIRKKGRRVMKIGEGWNALLPSWYLGSQRWVNWKSGEILIRGKRQNLRLQVLSILDIRKNICRQKMVEMSPDFLRGRSPCSDVHSTPVTSGPCWSVKSGPRPHRSSSVQDGHVGHPGVGGFPISLQAEEIVFNAILFQTEKVYSFMLPVSWISCICETALETLHLYKKWI